MNLKLLDVYLHFAPEKLKIPGGKIIDTHLSVKGRCETAVTKSRDSSSIRGGGVFPTVLAKRESV